MMERGSSAGDDPGTKTRYHLLNQVNGRWNVKAEHLKPLHERAVSLIQEFADIKIWWVPRKANAEADALASTPLGPLKPKPKPSIDELPLD
jgi:hypothetical protein